MKEDKLKISKRRLKGDDGFKVFSVRLEQGLVDRIYVILNNIICNIKTV